MRYILIILVFLSVGANAQMVIKAHANYRPYASPAANLLLDDYPNAAAAYSLRKLDKDYTGAAIRVRKDTTGQPEQDIGFTASGDLDTAALKSFLNARSGFVVTWYNQADSAGIFGVRNLTQSTAASQPRIALNGVIEREYNKVFVRFAGNHLINNAVGTLFSGQNVPISTLSVLKMRNVDGAEQSMYAFSSNATEPIRRIRVSAGIFELWHRADNQQLDIVGIGNANTNLNNINVYQTGTQNTTEINGTIINQNISSSHTVSTTTTRLVMGGLLRGSFATAANVNYYELIIYPSNVISNRIGLNNNINDYYW
jgi:hypothetical protein